MKNTTVEGADLVISHGKLLIKKDWKKESSPVKFIMQFTIKQ